MLSFPILRLGGPSRRLAGQRTASRTAELSRKKALLQNLHFCCWAPTEKRNSSSCQLPQAELLKRNHKVLRGFTAQQTGQETLSPLPPPPPLPAPLAGNSETRKGCTFEIPNGPQTPFFSMGWPGRPSHPDPLVGTFSQLRLLDCPDLGLRSRLRRSADNFALPAAALAPCLDLCQRRPLLWLWLLCLGTLCLFGLRHDLRLLVCPIVSEPCRAQPPPWPASASGGVSE